MKLSGVPWAVSLDTTTSDLLSVHYSTCDSHVIACAETTEKELSDKWVYCNVIILYVFPLRF